MIKLGSHISFKSPNYLLGAAAESISNQANCMMIYLGAPQTTKRISTEKYKYNEYLEKYSKLITPDDIIVHAPYIVNPSSVSKSKFAIDFLVQEIEKMNYIGAKYLVLHPGSYTTFSVQESLDTFIASVKQILSRTKDVVICVETMAGKGTEVGINFDQINYFIRKIRNDRFAVCLDTCHVFDAGYDIRKYEEFKAEINKYNLLPHIKVIHLNDSKNSLGSHKDRHANIDKGSIGLETLAKFVHDPDFDNIPIILETPWVGDKPIYDQEIKMLLEHKAK
ncbi:Endonuclease IV [Mycoplasmopsis agalactiae 14628]|uniref:Probable endonuclease 4 n=1 Tax=Mycoplasmopsis agalactiae 14628 TaxID=1110504 RepID=I5D6Y5_MYCAA|nr:deoxyribonuclease IV [Mycoplasmopsis agalactiae]EIN15444.1 Endonuclease IV [Mycoplasmopsis agalactiae 14628]